MGCQITTKEMLFIIGVVRKKIDILCLQETHSTDKVELKWKREWGGGGQIVSGIMALVIRGV